MPARASRHSAGVPRPAPAEAPAETALADALHEWAFKAGRVASPQPREFLADLARWRRDAVTGHPPEVARLRLLSIRVAEGIALMRTHANARARASLEATRADLEARLHDGVPAGTEHEVRLWLGGVHLALGTVARQEGDYRAALHGLRAAAGVFRDVGARDKHAVALGNMANVYGEVGLFDEQLALALEARAILVAADNPVHAAMQSFNLAETHLARGDLVAARQCCLEAERVWAREGRTELVLQARIQLAVVDVKEGRATAAVKRLRRLAEPCAAAACRAIAEPLRLEALGGAWVALRRWPEAIAAFHEALAVLRDEPSAHHEARLWVELGRAHAAGGAWPEAAAAAHRALERFAAVGVPEAGVADAETLLSSAAQARGDWREAWEHERRRREAHEEFFRRDRDRRAAVLAARHQLDLAHAEAALHRAENSRLGEALAAVAARLQPGGGAAGVVASGGAGPVAASAAGALPEDPSSLRPLGLTKRESEVLWWVAEGKTNDEICAILGTGLANVKKQLQNIYVKLGVENRTAAAGRALRHLRGG